MYEFEEEIISDLETRILHGDCERDEMRGDGLDEGIHTCKA